MTFNELNAVEHFIIHQLSGVNLNPREVSEEKPLPFGTNWQYRSPEEIDRGVNEVLVELSPMNKFMGYFWELSK